MEVSSPACTLFSPMARSHEQEIGVQTSQGDELLRTMGPREASALVRSRGRVIYNVP